MESTIITALKSMTIAARIATCCVIAAIGIFVWAAIPVLTVSLMPPLDVRATGSDTTAQVERFTTALFSDRDFIISRSPFFTPAPPKPPVIKNPDSNDKPDTRPVGPLRYNGPKLTGIAGDQAFFDANVLKGEKWIAVGQEGGSVELIRVEPPWKAIVEWRGTRYTLNLLDTAANYAADLSDTFGDAPGGRTNTGIFGSGVTQRRAPTPRAGRANNADIGLPSGGGLFSTENNQGVRLFDDGNVKQER